MILPGLYLCIKSPSSLGGELRSVRGVFCTLRFAECRKLHSRSAADFFSPLANGKLVSASCHSGRISTRVAGRSVQMAVRTALRHLRNSAELFCHFAEFRVVKLRELCPGLIIMAVCHGVNLTRIVGKPVNFKFGSWLDSRASVTVMADVTVMLR